MTTKELIAKLKEFDHKGKKEVSEDDLKELLGIQDEEESEEVEGGRYVVAMKVCASSAIEVGHREWKIGDEVDYSWQPDDFCYYDSDGIAIPRYADLVVEYSDGEEETFPLNDERISFNNRGLLYDLSEGGPYLYARAKWDDQTWQLQFDAEDSHIESFDPSRLKLRGHEVEDCYGGRDAIITGFSYEVPGDDDDLWSSDEEIDFEKEFLGGNGFSGVEFTIYKDGEWLSIEDAEAEAQEEAVEESPKPEPSVVAKKTASKTAKKKAGKVSTKGSKKKKSTKSKR